MPGGNGWATRKEADRQERDGRGMLRGPPNEPGD